MSQNVVNSLSDEDWQFIENSQLGKPESIFWMQASYIRFYRRIGIALIIFCLIVVVFIASVMVFLGWPLSSQRQIIDFPPLLLGILGMMLGGYILRIEVPRLMSGRVIACEKGLLFIRGKRIEAVYWRDILAMRQEFGGLEYTIKRPGGKQLAFERFYTNVEALLALIRQRGGQREV